MPRIRKKTSKRGTSHQRAKVKHKVSESRKKAKKEAKKNPQWKSKQKKDPGIPNNFPYKDEILAEIAAQRRQEEEEKRRRKELKKAEKAAAIAAEKDEGDEQEDMSGLIGVSTIGGSSTAKNAVMSSSAAKGKARSAYSEEVDGEEDVPILMNSEYKDMRSVLDKADVVLHVVDAREPLASYSRHLKEYLNGKGKKRKLAVVINKIDTCPREVVSTWLSRLRQETPFVFPFRSASAFLPQAQEQQQISNKARQTERISQKDAVGTTPLLEFIASEAATKKEGQLQVAIVGVANTGKSSVVNSLLRKSASPIYKLSSTPMGPSTTERPLELTLTHNEKEIKLIDTPALTWEHVDGLDGGALARLRANDLLLRSKGRIDKAKEPVVPVMEIVKRADAEDLMLYYTLPSFTPGDGNAFLAALGRSRGLVKMRGEIDYVAAARIVLRDWSTGKLPRYAQPDSKATAAAPGAGSTDGNAAINGIAGADAESLGVAPLRKEMRRGCGIVRLKPQEIEERKIALDVKWDAEVEEEGDEIEVEEDLEDEDDDNDDNDDDDISENDDMVDEEGGVGIDEVDEEETDEETDEDMVDLPPPPPTPPKSSKRKRPTAAAAADPQPPAPKAKKVAFAPPPKGSKQARSQQQPSSVKTPTPKKTQQKRSDKPKPTKRK